MPFLSDQPYVPCCCHTLDVARCPSPTPPTVALFSWCPALPTSLATAKAFDVFVPIVCETSMKSFEDEASSQEVDAVDECALRQPRLLELETDKFPDDPNEEVQMRLRRPKVVLISI